MDGKIFVIAGASGSGKTTITDLTKNLGERIITSTTRGIRPGEVDGIDYNFLDKEDFETRSFVESDTKYENYYGTEIKEVESKINGGSAYVILTHDGYLDFKKVYGDRVVGIYIYCSRKDTLSMLIERGEVNIEKRMADYDLDIMNMPEYDYVITNKIGEIEDSIESLNSIISVETRSIHNG